MSESAEGKRLREKYLANCARGPESFAAERQRERQKFLAVFYRRTDEDKKRHARSVPRAPDAIAAE